LKKIKNNKNISYLGFLPEDEMINQLKNSQVLCVTRTNSEFANYGFPFKLSEYMSFGIPVLTTTVSDIPFLLEDKHNAFFATPEDINSIVNTINLILDDYKYSKQVGMNGQEFSNNTFSIDVIGFKFLNFLERIE
jgi:glycosyltransferase involved in cell wall biosynthesis